MHGCPYFWQKYGKMREKHQFLHDQHLPRWPTSTLHNNSDFRLKSILTSCQINGPERFKGSLLMTSSCCSAVWGCALPDQLEGPPSAGGLPAPRPLLPPHFGCFVHWTRCPLRKVINHNYLLRWQSPSHSSAHSFSPSLSLSRSLHPSLPSCPLPLLFLFNFTRDQCGCQAIYLFRALLQMRGPQKATAALPQIWSASVNFQSGVTSWQWHVALDGCVYNNVTFFFPCPQGPFCLRLLDVTQGK